MWILFLIAALAALSAAQQDCSRGACYPPSGDLLLGRDRQLHASSTCGLTGTEIFCTPFGQWKMKCCPCDSRNPLGRNARPIQNVLSSAGPNRWWQSRKDANPVSLQLDLQNTFQLDTLVMQFMGPRPNALVIERSTDSGNTWQPVLYMASDCRSAFPHISTYPPQRLQDTYCHNLTPLNANPYLDQTIYFSPLRQYSSLNNPKSQKIEAVSDYTNLRINLTELAQVPRLPGRSPSLFYALREMQVLGSCFCHGHANRCMPDTSTNQLPSTQVSAVCDCQHNTAGVNCERCADLYNDLPWRPAEEGNTHTCKRCECNNHAQRCRFDAAQFEASGRVSGGVCEGCLHYTTGPRCDRCAPNHYRNPRSAIDRPDACLRCQCSAAGTEGGAQCDPDTGVCRCKANVEGPRCDRCKSGYYGLSADNPLGCSKCSCNTEGSLPNSPCDPVTGQCTCRPNFQGLTCDRCSTNYWNPHSGRGCEPCNCDVTNSLSQSCDRLTGQCQCRPGFGGRTCTECPENTYGNPRRICRPCKCEHSGTESCDKQTGECRCLPGVTGSRCDSCARGRCSRYPDCPVCPSCFFTLDRQIQELTRSLQQLSIPISTLPGAGDRNLGPRIRALEATLTHIRDMVSVPAPSAGRITEALEEMRRLREQANRLSPELFPQGRGLVLAQQLEDLSAKLQQLSLNYNAKRDALRNTVTADLGGAFSTIETAYRESTDAMKGAEATKAMLKHAEVVRGDAITLQGTVQLANTRDLDNLDYLMASQPNLTPAAVQVCGSTRSTPCTPLKCDGELCPTPAAAACQKGKSCVGALPLGTKALADTEEVKARLQELNDKIMEATAQIQETQDSTNNVRSSTDQLADQIKQARNDLETDMQDIRDFVKKLKNFLSEPNVDPTDIQTVSEGILNTKLPLNLAALKRKIQEMRKLAAGLPDSTRLLASTAPQLDLARRLLEEARDARDTALGVKDRVDNLLGDLKTVESSLDDADGKVQESMDIVDDINNNIEQAKAQLDPALKALEGVTDLTATMRPQLDNLKALAESTDQLAGQAQDEAEAAKETADTAAKNLKALEDQLELLKKKAKESNGRGDGAGSPGERLQRLQGEATALIQDTVDMMRRLTGTEKSLEEAAAKLAEKSQRMTGLDDQLLSILKEIRQREERLTVCT